MLISCLIAAAMPSRSPPHTNERASAIISRIRYDFRGRQGHITLLRLYRQAVFLMIYVDYNAAIIFDLRHGRDNSRPRTTLLIVWVIIADRDANELYAPKQMHAVTSRFDNAFWRF